MISPALSKVRVRLGPPGTGKTTACMEDIESLLELGVEPEEIAFVSFTNAATNEARDRAVKRFDLDPERFPYFRTIHSMAYRALPERVPVMSEKDWGDFGEQCAYSFSDDGAPADDTLNFTIDGDCLRTLDGLARVMRVPIERAMLRCRDDLPPHITPSMVEIYRERLATWKVENRKIDFVDMLEQAADSGWRPPVRYAFVDEAQDNSRIQNSLVKQWFIESPSCEQVTIAGDDDQGIHDWAGAEKGDLLWLARHAQCEILQKSWRVPRAVHALAQRIIVRNRNRVPKVYEPRDADGLATLRQDLRHALTSEMAGSIFVLVRTRVIADTVRRACMQSGRLFSAEVGTASPLDRKDPRGAFGAICSWRKDSAASAGEFRSLLSLIPSGKGSDRILPVGIKARAEENADPVPLWRARRDFKLEPICEQLLGPDPFELLVRLSNDDRAYLGKVFREDPDLRGPRLTLTTKHRSKGREADNVIVLADLGRRAASGRARSAEGWESENCVSYVAVTRARSNLFVVLPSTKDSFEYAQLMRAS